MDLLSHWLVPFLIILLIRKPSFTLLILSIFSIAPDFDIIFLPSNLHRFYTHNLFIVLIPLICAFIFLNLKKRKAFSILLIISFFLFSHIMLDLTYGGVPLLYPCSSKFFEISIELQTYGNLKPFWHNYFRAYTPQKRTDWRDVSDSTEIKPGIIAWRNAFMILFTALPISLALLFGKKLTKHNNKTTQRISNS